MLEFDNMLDKSARPSMTPPQNTGGGRTIAALRNWPETAKRQKCSRQRSFKDRAIFVSGARDYTADTRLLWVEQVDGVSARFGQPAPRPARPLTEYRKEGVRVYKELEETFRGNVFDISKLIPGGGGGRATFSCHNPLCSAGESKRNRPQRPCPCNSGKNGSSVG